ncbi:hypothetical protein [Microbulbifer sp. VAAF005]|nr:hypothetical protein [Microbulbifer sp. VAAF005]WHI44500.1 hypothetical protein P0078_12095 [Microbulbifer sp. VAAF005]
MNMELTLVDGMFLRALKDLKLKGSGYPREILEPENIDWNRV